MNLVENIEHINWDFRNEIPVLIFDIASNILDYVKLDDEDIEKYGDAINGDILSFLSLIFTMP